MCWLGEPGEIAGKSKVLIVRRAKMLALIADEIFGIIDSKDMQEHPSLMDIQRTPPVGRLAYGGAFRSGRSRSRLKPIV